jgi:antitoxin component YwqK of YwqJK toxin-antitoxin module
VSRTPLGETYYERENLNNAFVEMSEVSMKNGVLRGPAFTYNECFYVNTGPAKQSSKVDYTKCISTRSPRAVLDSVLLAGAHPRFGVTTAGVADHIVLERAAVFHLYGEANVMEMTWSFKGIQYSVTDSVANTVRLATPEERAQLDAGWLAWKGSRDKLVSYDEVH